MDGLAVSTASSEGDSCENAAVVLHNGTVFSLDGKDFKFKTGPEGGVEFVTSPGEGEPNGDKLAAEDDEEGEGQATGLRLVVDTSRGLVLSVTETGVALEGNSSSSDLSGQLLVPSSEVIDGQNSSLFDGHGEVINIHSIDHVDVTGGENIQLSASSVSLTERKKGGWPKGRKRKPEPLSNAPKAPASAYVLYSIERRPQIKQSAPNLPFAEVTKLMGNEWSALPMENKQKYLDKADEDKKRYIEELKVYQKTKAYQQFLKKKRMNGCPEEESSSLEVDAAALSDDLEDDGLYCRACNMYFNSQHNRREHFYGKQHLQNIVNDYEKDLQQQLIQQDQPDLSNSELSNDMLTSGSTEEELTECTRCAGPDDIEGFIQQFMEKHCDREAEIRELRRAVGKGRQRHAELLNKIESYKEIQEKLGDELIQLSRISTALSAQIDGLKMVPTLFGVINF